MAQVTTAAGVQITYDAKREGLIQRHIAAQIATFEGPDHGLMGAFQVSQSLHILGANLNITGIEDEEAARHSIFAAATDFQNRPVPSTLEFLEALGVRAKRFIDQPFQEFHVLLPLNVAFENLAGIESFSVNGVQLNCLRWNDVQNAYATEELRTQIYHFLDLDNTPDLWNWSGTPLLAKIYARTGHEAFQRASEAYERLCATINFVLDTDRVDLARPRPKASVVKPVAYGVFQLDGALAEPFVSEEALNFQSHLARPQNFEQIYRLFNEIFGEQTANYSTRRFINALLGFHYALSTTDWSKAYLSLWQCLEILAFGSQQRYDMSQVVERISALMKASGVIQDFLALCANKRNDLVHRGQFSADGQSEVILLKVIVRRCLWHFFSIRGSFPTEVTLEEYYLHAALSTEKLVERKRVIETLLPQP